MRDELILLILFIFFITFFIFLFFPKEVEASPDSGFSFPNDYIDNDGNNYLTEVQSNDGSYASQTENDENWMNVSFPDNLIPTGALVDSFFLTIEHYESDNDIDLKANYHDGISWHVMTNPSICDTEANICNYTFDLYTDGVNTSAKVNAINISWKIERFARPNDIGYVDFFLINYSYHFPSPEWYDVSVNDTDVFVNEPIKHRVRWVGGDSLTLSGYIFSTNVSQTDCSDGWDNSSFIDMTGTGNWSNHTWTIPSECVDKTVGWKVYANNSGNKWNVSNQYNYSVYKYGTLEVVWTTGSQINSTDCNDGSPCDWENYTIKTANATVTCTGGTGAKCGIVDAGIRYNVSGTPDTYINTTEDIPFYILGGAYKEMLPTYAWNSSDNTDITASVNVSDDNYAEESCIGSACSPPLLYFNFSTSETYDNLTIEGYMVGGGVPTSFFSCWDGDSWGTISDCLLPTTESQETCSISQCSNSDGNYTIRVQVIADDAEIYVDYLFINKSGTAQNPISLGTLNNGDSSQANFTVNMTDNTSSYALDVFFNSSYGNSNIPDNETGDAIFGVTGAGVFISISISTALQSGIMFGTIDPNTNDNPALNNTNGPGGGTAYNITIDSSTNVNVDLYHNAASDLTYNGNTISISNVAHAANVSLNTGENLDDYTEVGDLDTIAMSTTYAIIGGSGICENLQVNDNCWITYWLDVPIAQIPGDYNTTYEYCAVENAVGSSQCN